MRFNFIACLLIMFAVASHAQRSVTVLTNSSVVAYPTNFWQANLGLSGTGPTWQAETMMGDYSESTGDVMIPDYLASYYSTNAADVRFARLGYAPPASLIPYTEDGLTYISGGNVDFAIASVDTRLADLYARIQILQTSSVSWSTSTVNCIITYSPTAYSPTGNTVQAHIEGIDAALEAIIAILQSGGAPGNVLTNVAATGADSVDENSAAAYTATAYYSDGTTTNVSTNATWALSGAPAGVYMETNMLRVGTLSFGTSVVLKATHAFNGLSRYGTKTITLNDLSAATVTNLLITGTTNLWHESPIPITRTYTAYAQWSDGRSVDVSDAAIWMTNTVFDLTTNCYSSGRNIIQTDSSYWPFWPATTNTTCLESSNVFITAVYTNVDPAITGKLDMVAFGNMPVNVRKTSAVIIPDTIIPGVTNLVAVRIYSALYPSGLLLPSSATYNWTSTIPSIITNGTMYLTAAATGDMAGTISCNFNWMRPGHSVTSSISAVVSTSMPTLVFRNTAGTGAPEGSVTKGCSWFAANTSVSIQGYRLYYIQGDTETEVTFSTYLSFTIVDNNGTPTMETYTPWITPKVSLGYQQFELYDGMFFSCYNSCGPFRIEAVYDNPLFPRASKSHNLNVYINPNN